MTIATLFALAALAPAPSPTTRLVMDPSGRTLAVVIGPFVVDPAMEMDGHEAMMMMEPGAVVGHFPWPRTGSIRGIALALTDSGGAALPRRLLHHLNVMNFDRRQLVYPITERIVAFGQETDDIRIPASVGMPVQAGQRIGIVAMWHNTTGRTLAGVWLTVTFELNPRRQWPPPMAALPIMADANMQAGGINTFDVPPGGVTRSYVFTLAVSGHLMAASGHLHDHGEWIRLEEAESGREIVTVRAVADSAGRLLRVSRELLAVWSDGPHLEAGRRYRVLVRYANPTADTLHGMMGLLGGLFAPDDLADWPAVDRGDAAYLADLANIPGALAAIGPTRQGEHRQE